MDAPIPSPHEGFLQFRLPNLRTLTEAQPLWRLEASRAERTLFGQEDASSAEWLWQAAALLRDRGRLEKALDTCTMATRAAERAGSPRLLALSYAIEATVHIIKGNFTTARGTLNKIRPITLGADDPIIGAIYNEALGTLLLRSVGSTFFEFEEAGERFALAEATYRELGDVAGQLRAAAGTASVQAGRGQYFLALEHIDAALGLALAHRQWPYIGQLLGCAAFAFRDQGYRNQVLELFELSIEWATYVGDIPTRIRSVAGIGGMAQMDYMPPSREALDHAVSLICQAIWEAKEIGAGPMMLEMQIALATLFKKAGDPESQWKCRVIVNQIAESEAFEGAHRVIDWNRFITTRLEDSRDERFATRLEEAIEGSSDPFFVFDPQKGSDSNNFDLMNEFRNSAANMLLGIDSKSVRLLPDLVDVPEFAGLSTPLMRAAIDREVFEDEIRVFNAQGELVWYRRRVAPAGAGAVLTFRDVTSVHQIEDALREAAQRASEADRAKSEFLANMSHEVRTPINGVLGLAQLLQVLPLDPVARKYVDGILSSGKILLKVIGDVLDLSKIEARKLELNVGPVILSSLISEMVDLFGPQSAAKRVPLRVQMGSDVPATLRTDGASLRQVLANLIGNAIKFTDHGSIEVSVARFDGRLRFEVTDTGIGIPSHLLESIFEPFHQVNSEMDFGGTGLGLTISRRLIELMGGQMGVTSVEGQGSCFFFTLPISEVEPSVVHPLSQPVPEVRFDGLKVLLVEDNEVNTLVSEGMLSQLGCEVDCAVNGLEAVSAVKQSKYDLVLMDMRMPKMDGVEATREIRRQEQEHGGHLPIVALTAGALTQERDACLQAGMDGYLAKPFTHAALRQTIATVLGAPTLGSLGTKTPQG